ncbi:hypothetical protein KY284_035128 [Solanum tuberosum]|nr:hypothetical protein KY284_035128 [Solanum tuberosum]
MASPVQKISASVWFELWAYRIDKHYLYTLLAMGLSCGTQKARGTGVKEAF